MRDLLAKSKRPTIPPFVGEVNGTRTLIGEAEHAYGLRKPAHRVLRSDSDEPRGIPDHLGFKAYLPS